MKTVWLVASVLALQFASVAFASTSDYKATYDCTIDIEGEFNKDIVVELDGDSQKLNGFKSKKEWEIRLFTFTDSNMQGLSIGPTAETSSYIILRAPLYSKDFGLKMYPQNSISCKLKSLVLAE